MSFVEIYWFRECSTINRIKLTKTKMTSSLILANFHKFNDIFFFLYNSKHRLYKNTYKWTLPHFYYVILNINTYIQVMCTVHMKSK